MGLIKKMWSPPPNKMFPEKINCGAHDGGVGTWNLTPASILTLTPAARAVQLTATETTLIKVNCSVNIYQD